MTVTAPDVATVKLALRVDGDALDAEISRLIGVAVARANEQTRDAAVPEEIGRQAVILYVGWAFEAPLEIGSTAAGTWRRCGAEGMLKPWTRRYAGAIG